MSDQNRWHSRKASKIKASSGFWGRFSKPQKIQFYRWHSVFGVKKRFWGSEMKKNLAAFFVSENRQTGIPKRISIEKFYRTVHKRTVVIQKGKHIWKRYTYLNLKNKKSSDWRRVLLYPILWYEKNQKLQRLQWVCDLPWYK